MYIQYTINIKFDWDDNKNQSNFKKHGVWFEEARTIWADLKAVEYFDFIHSFTEDRFLRVGHSTAGKLVIVVFRENEKEHLIRIISARKVTSQERKRYEERV